MLPAIIIALIGAVLASHDISQVRNAFLRGALVWFSAGCIAVAFGALAAAGI